MNNFDSVCISVVSHGQGNLLRGLFSDLGRCSFEGLDLQILLTLNIPEDEAFLEEFKHLPVKVLRNTVRKGFGANHNAAFAASQADLFAVVNPDIRLKDVDIRRLLSRLDSEGIGACAPLVLSSSGTVEDSARKFPTVARLARRTFLGIREPDYEFRGQPLVVDWVAGMFIAFRREVFSGLGGFDERYFMYMEDADICRRIKRQGLAVVIDPSVTVIHDAQRASRRNMRHMTWHLRSAVRFILGI